MPTTHVLVRPGCQWHTIAPTLALLAPHRDIRVLADEPGPVRVAEGYGVVADGSWEALAEATEVLVPGGDVWEDAALTTHVRRALERGARIGAIGGGARLLAAAGAAVPDTGEDVVTRERTVAAKPWAAIAFARAFVSLAGVLPREEAAAQARALAGAPDLPDANPYERWVITLEAIPGVPTSPEQIRGHVEWLGRLERDGRLVLAGPLPEHAAGQIILRVATRADAEALMATDPFVIAGVRRPTLRRWLLSCDANGHLGRA